MKLRLPRWAYETRVRTVLLFVLLTSLVVQAGTVLLLERSAGALEGELVGPLYASLDEMASAPEAAESLPGGHFRRTRGLEERQQFFLRDTLSPSVASDWQELPPSARQRLLSGETVRVRLEEDGALALYVWRIEGKGTTARALNAGRALPAYGQFLRLTRWNALFRSVGLLLLLGAVFLVTRELTRPFHRLQKVALDAQQSLHMESAPSQEEWEALTSTFTATIARLKESQEELERRYVDSEEERLRLDRLNVQIIDALPSALVAADGEGRIVHYNRAATCLPGLGRPETGCLLHDFFAPWPDLARRFEARAANLSDEREGECYVELEGERHYFDFLVLPVWRGGTLVFVQDRTHVRRLEALVSQRARLAALGETAAGLAHELRNAMGAIVGYARLVVRTGGRQTEEIAERIEREAGEMEAMLTRFLEVARPAELSKAEVDGSALLSDTSERFRARFEEAGIQLELKIQGPVVIALDKVWFKQAMANLLENALQHVPRGGTVKMACEATRDSWVVSVEDDGPGIAAEWRTKVLSPFVSLRPGGTGLGLALVQKVMTAHDGRVEISQSIAGGAHIALTFPRSAAAQGMAKGEPISYNTTA
jgi:two-component system sensor histidine kinase FlrB